MATTGRARLVVQTFVGTRLLLAVVAVWVMVKDGKALTDVLGNWDVQHFLGIAANGYTEPNSIAFFPGWPAVLHVLSLIPVSPIVTGAILAIGCSAVATAALYRLGGTSAAIAWLFAPTAVFTFVPYTESLFCAAAFWAWERASSKHWWQAALLASVAASVRVSGLFLIGALGVLALTQAGRARERLIRIAWLILPALVVAAYGAFTWQKTGDPLGWYHAQATGWARGFTWPLDTLKNTIAAAQPGAYADHPEWSWMFRAEILSMAVGVIATVWCLFRKRLAEASWVAVQLVAFSFSYWFMSVNRAVLLWFPLWTNIGDAADRWRPSQAKTNTLAVVVVLALAVQAIWAWLFYTGRWAS